MISDHPGMSTSSVYVSGQIATVLHFEKDVDPTKTKLLGWEGRFEPLLVGSKMVVIMPIRDLNRDEVIPLLVTLVDGTEIPFIVKPQSLEKWGWTDHQVNVFKDREGYNAVLSSLNDSLKRERELSEENERFKKEENSVDHAYATLLCKRPREEDAVSQRASGVPEGLGHGHSGRDLLGAREGSGRDPLEKHLQRRPLAVQGRPADRRHVVLQFSALCAPHRPR
jgi:hypothetical protein